MVIAHFYSPQTSAFPASLVRGNKFDARPGAKAGKSSLTLSFLDIAHLVIINRSAGHASCKLGDDDDSDKVSIFLNPPLRLGISLLLDVITFSCLLPSW